MRTLTTDRLLLRPWNMDDVEAFYLYASSPDVGPSAGWKPCESLGEAEEILEKWTAEDYPDVIFAMEEKGTGAVVGSIGLHRDTHRAPNVQCRMLGYCTAKEHWGKGFATEAAHAVIDYAFQRLRVKLLTVDHYVGNEGSLRVIEKCGFTYEGTLRRALQIYDGTYKDASFYSMTAAEYRLIRAKAAGLSLVLPEEVSEEAFMAYYGEWGGEGPGFNPAAMELKGRSHKQWLKDTIAMRTNPPEGLVPSTAYFFADRAGRVLGAIDFRHELNDYLLHYAGHIGYGIRPSCRGKGLAPYMLALCLEKARERGLARVLVTCDDENQASASTIEDCGGELENRVEEEGRLTRRYWIDL
ncbi:GNAT family N-acetyltransferase [Oscillospiraceae bacterium 21-37]